MRNCVSEFLLIILSVYLFHSIRFKNKLNIPGVFFFFYAYIHSSFELLLNRTIQWTINIRLVNYRKKQAFFTEIVAVFLFSRKIAYPVVPEADNDKSALVRAFALTFKSNLIQWTNNLSLAV